MKHFSSEEWIDFVNQVVSASKKQEMEEHLGKAANAVRNVVGLGASAAHGENRGELPTAN